MATRKSNSRKKQASHTGQSTRKSSKSKTGLSKKQSNEQQPGKKRTSRSKGATTPKRKENANTAKTDKNKPTYKMPDEQPPGVGDIVHKVLNSPTVKPITDVLKQAIFRGQEDCGCDERKEMLNKLFRRYPVKPSRCLKLKEYNWLRQNLPLMEKGYTQEQIQRVTFIHKSVFRWGNPNEEPCYTCSKRIARYLNDLKQITETYGGGAPVQG